MADIESGSGEGESTSTATPLDSIFSASKSSAAEPASSDEKETEKEPVKEEASQKIPEGTSSPDEKQDDKAKDAEKQTSDVKKESKKAPDVKTDVKQEGTPTPEELAKKAEDEAKAKWDNEENPYFKRYRDTATNWQKEHQEKLQLQNAVAQMQQEVVTLRKIAEGTYDPEKDGPQQVAPETIAERALNVGKVLASRNAAVTQYGAEEVGTRLAEFSNLFAGNEIINKLVVDSDSPIFEAFRILDRYKFESKYGSTPADWHKSIRAEAEKELTEKIKAEVTAELMGRADKKQNTPRGLSSSRGSNGLGSNQNSKGKGPKSLGELFSR